MTLLNNGVVRLRRSRLANENLPVALDAEEREAMINAASVKFEELLTILQVDHQNDHNTRDTPKRVAKMFVEEMMSGRFSDPPALTEFDNVGGFDSLIVTGPIEVRSTCAHHMMPIYGEAFIGILPAANGRIIGLSKYDRVVDYFSSRLQIQEELVSQISRYLVEKTAPLGLAVRISAVHMCKTHRGVRSSMNGRMVSTEFHGKFNDDPALKSAFLAECHALGSR